MRAPHIPYEYLVWRRSLLSAALEASPPNDDVIGQARKLRSVLQLGRSYGVPWFDISLFFELAEALRNTQNADVLGRMCTQSISDA